MRLMGPAEGLDGLVDGGTWPQAVRERDSVRTAH